MVQDSQDSEQDLKTLEDLEMTFDLGENISADKAKGCYRVLRKYGLKLVKKDVNPCGYGLAHTDGKEIAEGEFSQKLQPAIEQAKSNIKDSSKKDDLTNPSNSPSTAGANHSNSTSSTLSTSNSSSEPPPPSYSEIDQSPHQNKSNTQTSQTTTTTQIQSSTGETKQDNNPSAPTMLAQYKRSASKKEDEIIITNVNSKFIIFYKNITNDTVGSFNCSEDDKELKAFLSSLPFNSDGNLPNVKDFKEIYEKIRVFVASKIKVFFCYVAENCPRMAKTMLDKNPGLASMRANVKNLANQEFERITGFQYAVWAHNFDMSYIIGKCLSEAERQTQINEAGQGAWVVKYGEHNLPKHQTESARLAAERALPKFTYTIGEAQEEVNRRYGEYYKGQASLTFDHTVTGVLIEGCLGGYHESFYLGKAEEKKRLEEERKARQEQLERATLELSKMGPEKQFELFMRSMQPPTTPLPPPNPSLSPHEKFIAQLLAACRSPDERVFLPLTGMGYK